MQNVREFHYPATVRQALELLRRLKGKGMAVAGGSVVSTSRDPKVAALIDVTRLGLSFIRQQGDTLRIGATTTIEELASSGPVKRFAGGLLASAAKTVRTHLMRNQTTLGGHIVATSPWSECSPALLALDATVSIATAGRKEERVPYELFAKGPSYRKLGSKQLVTEIVVQGKLAKAKSAYVSMARSSSDPAWIQVAVTLVRKGSAIADARVALGGVVKHAVRAKASEKLLAGRVPDRELFEEAALAAASGLTPIEDWRASAGYRTEVTRVLVRRALEAAWENGR